jgi:alkanesulfonate monooxygenase SsuD/methylene tetrahydromethanopterin reductase-like flavin-dependent oxidoreductase (luciferase family)
VYFDLRNPFQWTQDPSRLYGFTLEMCEEAEHLGASSAWFSEHHLFDDGYLTSPLTMAAAAAARTRRIRLGTAILIAPLHHPVEIAEQSVVVDLLSGGRLDLGVGAGYRVPEFELFDASMTARYRQTDDTVRRLRELWESNAVQPSPVQQPVPVWMGYQGPKGARRAGLLGERLLSANAALWKPYAEGLAEGGHPISTGLMAGGIQCWASDDPERDWPTVSKHIAYQIDSYRKHMVEGTDAPRPKPIDVERLVKEGRDGPLGSFIYGTPETVAGQIREYAAGAPVQTVYLWASIGGMSEADTAHNVQTICSRLAPLLADGGDG